MAESRKGKKRRVILESPQGKWKRRSGMEEGFRGECETDPAWKQLRPQEMLRHEEVLPKDTLGWISEIQEFLINYKAGMHCRAGKEEEKAALGRQTALWVKRCPLICLLNISEKTRRQESGAKTSDKGPVWWIQRLSASIVSPGLWEPITHLVDCRSDRFYNEPGHRQRTAVGLSRIY